MNKKMTGAEPKQVNLGAFLTQIFKVAIRHSKGYVFIEYGDRWRDALIAEAGKHGLRFLGTANTFYKAGSKWLPMHVSVFAHPDSSITSFPVERIEGAKGFDAVRRAIQPVAKPGAILLDPCCGLGNSARVSMEFGMVFRGNELNAARLNRTIERLRKGTKSP
jgi:hypothetical protein